MSLSDPTAIIVLSHAGPLDSDFSVLIPERLPSAASLRAALPRAVLDDIRQFVGVSDGVSQVAEATAWYEQSCVRIRSLYGVPSSPFAGDANAHKHVANEDDHDRFFRIRRVDGSAAAQFVASILRAGALFHGELDRAYGVSQFAAVGFGLHALLGHVAGAAEKSPMTRAPMTKSPVTLGPRDDGSTRDHRAPTIAPIVPLDRWILGHQIFALLTQGIVFALLDFETAAHDGRDVEAEAALGLVADLYLATAAAFRFAADFPPADYRDVIRPMMMPPQIGAGFSGLLSADHRHLVEVLTRLRPLMGETARRHATAHARVTAALATVYDDHKLVCAAFDGDEAPSLRGGTCELPGVVVLDRFKKARGRLLRPTGRMRHIVSDPVA